MSHLRSTARAAVFSLTCGALLTLVACGGDSGSTGNSVNWVVAPGDVQAASNTGYMTSSDDLVTVTLPVAPALGDIVKVMGVGQGGWRIAQNAGQVIRTNHIPSSYGLHWEAGTLSARAVASSADGKKLVAAVYNGKLQTSTDFGATWTERDTDRKWWSVASSADGTKLAAAVTSGQIYTSTDAGATWTARESNRIWHRIVSSQDGTVLAAVASGSDSVHISTDSGVTWTARQIAASVGPQDIAIAMNGARMIVGTDAGYYVSQDAGLTWTAHDPGYTIYMGVAISARGDTQVARAHIGPMLLSHDFGITWAAANLDEGGGAVACSDDGRTIVIVAGDGTIQTSYDAGINWNVRGQTGEYSVSAASSAEGSRLVVSGSTNNYANALLYHSIPRTTYGTSGAIQGGQFESIELQYIGNDTFTVLSHNGNLTVE